MSFFLRNKTRATTAKSSAAQRGHEPSNTRSENGLVKQSTGARKKRLLNEEIESEDDGDLSSLENDENGVSSSSDDEAETGAEKRLRLAKDYLAQMEREQAEKNEAGELVVTRESLAEKLKQESLEKLGRLHGKVARQSRVSDKTAWRKLKGRHRLSVTCLAVSPDARFAYTGSKDGVVLKSDLETGECVQVWKPFKGQHCQTKRRSDGFNISSLDVSNDGKLLCVGGADSRIHVFDASTDQPKLIKALKGHRAAITGLAFRRNSSQMFSSSEDKTAKVWDMAQMGFIDTMFGHSQPVLCVDSLTKERCVSAGGADRSIRMWKVADEAQLVFNGSAGCGSIENVRLINDDHFISGAIDGSLSVWSIFKKKPVCVRSQAHRTAVTSDACWVSSIATSRYTDLAVTGSNDGYVRLWEVSDDYKRLQTVGEVPIKGFINDLFVNDRLLIAAVGQEHKRGRWWCDRQARNGVMVIPLTSEHHDTVSEA